MDREQIAFLDMLLDDHFALWDFGDNHPDARPGTGEGNENWCSWFTKATLL